METLGELVGSKGKKKKKREKKSSLKRRQTESSYFQTDAELRVERMLKNLIFLSACQ